MEKLYLGLKLFIVGFPTVFGVLTLIVGAGFVLQNHIIPALEKWLPEEEIKSDLPRRQERQDAIPGDIVAAITTCVNLASKGKYSVLDIKKGN